MNLLAAKFVVIGAALAAACPVFSATPSPLGNAFTYQGQLKQSGSASTGTFDFECKLFDALTTGSQIGTTQTNANVAVTGGLFTIDLDFGAGTFDGNDRFLELSVRTVGGGTFTTLMPRQKLNTAPYAQFAKSSIVSGTIGNQVSFPNAGNSFSGSGAGLTALNAANISAGSLGVARMPTGGAWSLASTLNVDNNTFAIDPLNNLVGVGTATPAAKLQIIGGSDATPTGGGYLVTGATTGANIVIDDNEIMARNNSVVATLFLNNNGGDVSICNNGVGKLITPVIEITGADLAEEFPFSEAAEPGMVVAIDAAHPGQLCVARGAYNRAVAGIIAGANGFHTGALLGHKSGAQSGRPVALNGRVYVRATMANGEIEPGHLLTTSDIPGLAMKATDADRMPGAILGKAMTSIDPATGFVLVLVNLH